MFAEAIHKEFPNQLLAYNCSPSFNWSANLTSDEIRTFQTELNAMGYKFQFITLAGFHALNQSMYSLAQNYLKTGMSAYAELQNKEFDMETAGYTASKHQREVGTGYFDMVSQVISGGNSSTLAMAESTEAEQFHH
jgi:isocitrate lyase